jgi:Ni/Fe-hydrogenase subunit HybB-like protein
MITIAMTVAGVVLSTLHQSALGALFLLAPGKVHPLWYSGFLPVFFFISSIYAGFLMVIAVSTVLSRFMRNRADRDFLGSLDTLTIGLGKGASIVMFVYFALKLIGVAHDDHWNLLATPYGYWFLVEILLFVLVPGVVVTGGVKRNSARIVRFGAFFALAGVILNRLNVSLITFHWNAPGHLHHLVPPGREVMIVLAIATLHVILFRWIVNRMPVLSEHPDYREDG